MKHIIFAIVALATIFATYGENLNRTYWGCEMGKTEQSACADSIKSLFKKEQIEPRTEGNFVIAEKVWLYGYEFDAAKLELPQSLSDPKRDQTMQDCSPVKTAARSSEWHKAKAKQVMPI